jgi:signal transduction histidine kinase
MTLFCLHTGVLSRELLKKNAQHEAEVRHQKNLALENIKAQESERKRIAVMIHDDIGNRLNILSLWLNNLDTKGDELIKKYNHSNVFSDRFCQKHLSFIISRKS